MSYFRCTAWFSKLALTFLKPALTSTNACPRAHREYVQVSPDKELRLSYEKRNLSLLGKKQGCIGKLFPTTPRTASKRNVVVLAPSPRHPPTASGRVVHRQRSRKELSSASRLASQGILRSHVEAPMNNNSQ